MEIVKPDTHIDFMRYRKPVVAVSLLLVIGSIIAFFVPGPNYGIDFRGGTELQLAFKGKVKPGELRGTLEKLGYERPDVVAVEGSKNEYMIRIQEVSSLPEAEANKIGSEFRSKVSASGAKVQSFRVSPGGDKVTLRLDREVAPETVQELLVASGARVRAIDVVGQTADNRYEVQLIGVADTLVKQLQSSLGARGPEEPKRIEWVGPKAGEQLRDAAIKSLLYAIAFIMVYVAFRFDLRFAPGGVLAMFHDAIITLGVFIVLQKQVNLTTVAALLTIVGYSINDTIVVYDRIRENMSKLRKTTLRELINISTSQMLSRTIITSGTTLLSMSAFFIWGTDVIRDIAFAMLIGIAVGTYSSVYIAAPVTEWMDKRLFRGGSATA